MRTNTRGRDSGRGFVYPSRLGGATIAIALGLAFGVAAGIGGYTFVYAEGGSYLTDDPEACGNCHVMQAELRGWGASSHRAAAVCNDCHTPEGFFAKYFTKALNGWHHSAAFTTGDFHEPIRIGPRNREIAEQACRRCHSPLVEAIDHPGGEVSCLRCHSDVGHSR